VQSSCNHGPTFATRTPQGAAANKGVFTTVVSFAPGNATGFSPDAPAVMDEINGNTIEGALALAQVRGRLCGAAC
jgi:hypothetical protein